MHQFNFRALICLKDCFNAYLDAFVPWLSCDVLWEPFCALTNRIVAFCTRDLVENIPTLQTKISLSKET